jgi:hypothetical protein
MKENPSKENQGREAKVVLCRCPRTDARETSARTFGARIEKLRGDWLRTWAFKIDDDAARREGFDKVTVRGTLTPTGNYPGCPYCGTSNVAQCPCGRLFCWTGEGGLLTCPWCGLKGEYSSVETLNVRSGGF